MGGRRERRGWGIRRCGVLVVAGFLSEGLFARFIEDLDLLKCESVFSRCVPFEGAKRRDDGNSKEG